MGRGAARTAVDQIGTIADCLSSFAAFLEEAKPTEIRLLSDMLAEWQNWSGSLRKGNFFHGVAEAVLANDRETRLPTWPEDSARLAAAQAQVRRRTVRSHSRAR